MNGMFECRPNWHRCDHSDGAGWDPADWESRHGRRLGARTVRNVRSHLCAIRAVAPRCSVQEESGQRSCCGRRKSNTAFCTPRKGTARSVSIRGVWGRHRPPAVQGGADWRTLRWQDDKVTSLPQSLTTTTTTTPDTTAYILSTA
jgi:hypothetical protein